MTQHRDQCQITGSWAIKIGSVTTLDVQARILHIIWIHHFIIRKKYLNLEIGGYYYLEVLCLESTWVFNTLLEGKVASHSKHLKVPHDLWWTMSPCFEGNPLPHLKHSWLNCPHLTLTEACSSWKMGQAEQIRTNPDKESKIKLSLSWHGM